MTMNKILIIGNVGGEPEMRYAPSGDPVTSFSVATTRRYTVEGEQREETQWFRISAWNRLAENCNQYVTKGMKVYVEGRLSVREYVTQDGQARTSLDVRASDVRFLNRAGEPGGGQGEGMRGGPGEDMGRGGGYDSSSPPEGVEDLPW